jgi:predicted house-cleaning noncanonical NTP pyrophosphatase (MazG superfamily)
MSKAVSEQELKERLSNKLSSEEIEDLIDRYVEAVSLEDLPDMSVITELAQRSQEERLLRVRFSLESEQYDALAAYFGEKERAATVLAQKALEEFISLIT